MPWNILGYRLVWPFRFVSILVFGRFGLWPFRFMADSVWGRFGLWPFRFVAIPVCGRSGLWPFRLWPFRFVAVMNCYPLTIASNAQNVSIWWRHHEEDMAFISTVYILHHSLTRPIGQCLLFVIRLLIEFTLSMRLWWICGYNSIIALVKQ